MITNDSVETGIFDLWQVGRLALEKSEYSKAQMVGEQMVKIARQGKSNRGIAYSFMLLGLAFYHRGEYEKAQKSQQHCLVYCKRITDPFPAIVAYRSLAEVALAQGNLEEAQNWLDKSHQLNLAGGINWEMNRTLSLFGEIAYQRGSLGKARLCLDEGLELSQSSGDQQECARIYALLAEMAFLDGDAPTARQLYEKSLQLAVQHSNRALIASYLEGLGMVVAVQRKIAWAARLWGVAEGIRQVIGAPMPPIELAFYERIVEIACSFQGEEEFNATWMEGWKMLPEEVLQAEDLDFVALPEEPFMGVLPEMEIDGTTFSQQEQDVLRLLVQEKNHAQIAEELGLNVARVNSSVRSIYSKLQVSSRLQVLRYTVHYRLL